MYLHHGTFMVCMFTCKVKKQRLHSCYQGSHCNNILQLNFELITCKISPHLSCQITYCKITSLTKKR